MISKPLIVYATHADTHSCYQFEHPNKLSNTLALYPWKGIGKRSALCHSIMEIIIWGIQGEGGGEFPETY